MSYCIISVPLSCYCFGPNILSLNFPASDVDLGMGGQFVYSISGQGLSAFKIDPVTGVITTRRPLDREKKARSVC